MTGTGFFVPDDRFPVTLPFMFGETAGDALCDTVWDAVEAQKLVEERIRREQPVGRIWDAEWACQHVMGSEYSAKFSWISNDTGPGQTEFPFDGPIAQWIYDYQGRMDRGEGRTVGITVDYCGARWSGIMDKFSVEQRGDGDRVLVVDWVHDYEKATKWYYVVPNPFTSDSFQFPRAWLLAGPVTWILRTTLFLAIWREHNPFLTWPDDPMDLNNWATMGLDISNWHTVVKPESFLQAMASGVVWGVVTSRWESFHDMAHYMLEDSELSVVCRRYLPGDEPPWEGADLRYGTLVVDFVDKSGIQIGTSNGGNVFSGLARTINEFADDFLDSTSELISDAPTPSDYFTVDKRYTDRVKPYVIFYEGETSAVQTSSWVYSPTKGVQVSVGGHSAPGVNECLAGDTLIDGPDGKERIDVLAERGQSFRVWSITPEGNRVAATALYAFRKGYADLFTYRLTDGRSITVTNEHRFLTPSGFMHAADIKVGDPICTVDWSQDPVDEDQRQVSDADYLILDVPSQEVECITAAGSDYFYDMTVPGWENYSAHGIWNHNTISATIQAIGDVLGNLVQIGSLGGTIDTLLAPIYEDTIASWQSYKSNERANNTGWDRLFSYFQDGAGKAYTISSLLVLRAGLWATKTVVSWKVSVADGRPYLVGDQGKGHFFLDDRVGLVLSADNKIHMDRCRRLDLAWGPDSPPEWTINIGDERIWQDPAQRALGRIERLIAGLHNLGVW